MATDDRLADPQMGINNQALALLHMLAGMEPSFAVYNAGYDICISTSPLYNGRERGIVLSMHAYSVPVGKALFIFFAEGRNHDGIVIESWIDQGGINPPT